MACQHENTTRVIDGDSDHTKSWIECRDCGATRRDDYAADKSWSNPTRISAA